MSKVSAEFVFTFSRKTQSVSDQISSASWLSNLGLGLFTVKWPVSPGKLRLNICEVFLLLGMFGHPHLARPVGAFGFAWPRLRRARAALD